MDNPAVAGASASDLENENFRLRMALFAAEHSRSSAPGVPRASSATSPLGSSAALLSRARDVVFALEADLTAASMRIAALEAEVRAAASIAELAAANTAAAERAASAAAAATLTESAARRAAEATADELRDALLRAREACATEIAAARAARDMAASANARADAANAAAEESAEAAEALATALRASRVAAAEERDAVALAADEADNKLQRVQVRVLSRLRVASRVPRARRFSRVAPAPPASPHP